MKSFLLTWKELYEYREVITNFVVTSLKMRYKRSSLGFLWTLLNPLLTMVIMAVVFSMVFRFKLDRYSIYIFSGLLPWNFINSSAINGSMSFIFNESYIKKIYLPKLMFPITALLTELTNTFFSLVSLSIIGLFVHMKISWPILILPYALLSMFVFMLGLMLVLSVLTVYFRDLHHITIIIFSAIFYMCPVIYPEDLIPPQYMYMLYFNPFYYYIKLFRCALYENVWPSWQIMTGSFGLAIVSFIVGFIILKKRENDLVFRL